MINIDPYRFYSPKELISANGGPLPMSISAIYSAIKSGRIPSKQLGKRLLIPGKYLEQLINSK
ncbi:MAG: hypothetical protein Q4E64_08015 [Phascolarctobacterium sp.]|uniref:hypothetical protein n=1 Tax=Phascolarctobacterium sp. TaxID=2049039 RepID=UPI0026DBFF53|nr:hypothetical protein [Phascolarctobacterium sp.]MDO4921754.1 hypothetical protein [Phascolarctobacterium sp.]